MTNFNRTPKETIATVIDSAIYTALLNNLGGQNSLSFRMLSDMLDSEINEAVNKEFDVNSVSDIPADSVIEAILFVLSYKPSADIKALSKECEKDFEKFVYKFVEDLPKDTFAYQQLITDYMDSLPDSTSLITDNDIGYLECEIESAVRSHLNGVKHSKFYTYLFNVCSEELNKALCDELEIESLEDILVRELTEVLMFIGEWTPSYDTLCLISELEPHKITGKVTKR